MLFLNVILLFRKKFPSALHSNLHWVYFKFPFTVLAVQLSLQLQLQLQLQKTEKWRDAHIFVLK
jgi:hypothetical protein